MPKTPKPTRPTKPEKTSLFATAFERVRKTTGLFRTPTPKPGERREIRETILGAIGSWEKVPAKARKTYALAETGEIGELTNERLSHQEISTRTGKKEQIKKEISE